MTGTKKLQDLYTDAHIAGEERRNYPVLVDDDGEGRILAVMGLRVAQGVETEWRPEMAGKGWIEVRMSGAAPR